MKNKFYLLLFTLLFSFSLTGFAQKKVVIMGSSTAAGAGATNYNFSWAGKLETWFNRNTGDGIDTTFYNIAVWGYTTYELMPSSYVAPGGRPDPDTESNVTKALSYNPDVVIINLPNNDVGQSYSKTEILANFRLLFDSITASGAKCYISTTQPRNDYSDIQRGCLRELVDSITAQFGVFAVDFWDDIVTSDGLNMLRDDIRDLSSSVHLNDIGHDLLFARLRDKNIFGSIVLPLKLSRFQAQLKNNTALIQWRTEQEEPNTVFEIQRSADGRNFESLFSQNAHGGLQAADYSGTDLTPLPGKSFYRLKIREGARQSFSAIVSLMNNKIKGVSITSIHKANAAEIVAAISIAKSQQVTIGILNASGALVQQQKQYINTPAQRLTIPVNNLAPGQYYIRIITEDEQHAVKAFIN